MRRFKSAEQAQRFLHIHGVIQNPFRLGRHRLELLSKVVFGRLIQAAA